MLCSCVGTWRQRASSSPPHHCFPKFYRKENQVYVSMDVATAERLSSRLGFPSSPILAHASLKKRTTYLLPPMAKRAEEVLVLGHNSTAEAYPLFEPCVLLWLKIYWASPYFWMVLWPITCNRQRWQKRQRAGNKLNLWRQQFNQPWWGFSAILTPGS